MAGADCSLMTRLEAQEQKSDYPACGGEICSAQKNGRAVFIAGLAAPLVLLLILMMWNIVTMISLWTQT